MALSFDCPSLRSPSFDRSLFFDRSFSLDDALSFELWRPSLARSLSFDAPLSFECPFALSLDTPLSVEGPFAFSLDEPLSFERPFVLSFDGPRSFERSFALSFDGPLSLECPLALSLDVTLSFDWAGSFSFARFSLERPLSFSLDRALCFFFFFFSVASLSLPLRSLLDLSFPRFSPRLLGLECPRDLPLEWPLDLPLELPLVSFEALLFEASFDFASFELSLGLALELSLVGLACVEPSAELALGGFASAEALSALWLSPSPLELSVGGSREDSAESPTEGFSAVWLRGAFPSAVSPPFWTPKDGGSGLTGVAVAAARLDELVVVLLGVERAAAAAAAAAYCFAPSLLEADIKAGMGGTEGRRAGACMAGNMFICGMCMFPIGTLDI